ncbi:alpha/beta hydrolase [Microbacterium jejuense]
MSDALPSPSGTPHDSRLIDVDGHGLYLDCKGSGSPTVVYVHGWTDKRTHVPHEGAEAIQTLLADDHRVCLYDRRNVGSSETVDAAQTPDDMLHDMEGVLANGGVEPPYILMAASFGGLLAYSFLNHHPDQVSGVVFLDAFFPDELALDAYLPADKTFQHFQDDDMCCTLERINEYALIDGLQQYIGHEPAIPMIYLAAAQGPRGGWNPKSPDYSPHFTEAQQAFVDRFSPGELRWVDAPHFMEPEIPDVIAQAVRDVAAGAETG